MKGCICHFIKWQIHPYISKGTYYVLSAPPCPRWWCFYVSSLETWLTWHLWRCVTWLLAPGFLKVSRSRSRSLRRSGGNSIICQLPVADASSGCTWHKGDTPSDLLHKLIITAMLCCPVAPHWFRSSDWVHRICQGQWKKINLVHVFFSDIFEYSFCFLLINNGYLMTTVSACNILSFSQY